MHSNHAMTIYGAGMSGLMAAINLACEGHTVTMYEREKGYGAGIRLGKGDYCDRTTAPGDYTGGLHQRR
ncbi:MAG: NAD(P)/FAD-dependent oxidoreductase [Syntrophaceae bacterium]